MEIEINLIIEKGTYSTGSTKHSGIQANDIANNLQRPIDTVKKQIGTLVKKDLIEHRGSRKTGGYFLKDK